MLREKGGTGYRGYNEHTVRVPKDRQEGAGDRRWKHTGNFRVFIPDSLRDQNGKNMRHRDHSWQARFYIYPCLQSQRTL